MFIWYWLSIVALYRYTSPPPPLSIILPMFHYMLKCHPFYTRVCIQPGEHKVNTVQTTTALTHDSRHSLLCGLYPPQHRMLTTLWLDAGPMFPLSGQHWANLSDGVFYWDAWEGASHLPLLQLLRSLHPPFHYPANTTRCSNVLFYCWAIVCHAGPTLNSSQTMVDKLLVCLPSKHIQPMMG